MTTLQFHRCGEWSHDALQVVLKPPWRDTKNRKQAHRIRPRAQTTDESLRLRSIDTTESGNGSNTNKFAPTADRLKGLSRNFVAAAPRYSSLLKLTGRKRHEVRMQTRERVFLSISDWVFRRVKDPLVEIDPETVNKGVVEERKAEMEGKTAEENNLTTGVTVDPSTAVATTSPSLFGYLPPGFPKGADSAALAAGIVLLLAALGSAAILGLRGNKTAGSVKLVTSGGQEANGSLTNGGARQGDRSPGILQESLESNDQTAQKQRVPLMTYPLESQAFMPIPQYSTALEQSDLPLPPSLSHGSISTKDKKIEEPPSSGEIGSSSSPDDDLPVSLETLKNDEEAVSSNGIVNANSQLEDAALEVAAELKSAATGEMAASPLLEELKTGTSGSQEEDSVDLDPTEDSPVDEPAVTGVLPSASEPAVAEPAVTGMLPSASESLEQLSEISVGQEYLLIGGSETLEAVRELPSPVEPMAALPASADVGVPVDSFLVYESAAQASPEELSSETIGVQFTSGQEDVPVDSIPFEREFQAGSDAEVVFAERHQEYKQALQKVLPAVSVGAGVAALSSFSGVDGALQVVGALAAASFLTREVMWAEPRQQLFDEIRSIKSHKELKQFLKNKNIFPELWSH